MQFSNDKIWEPLKTQGFHFYHLNINGLLPKTEELRQCQNNIKSAIFGITKSKLDKFVTKAEVNINGYSIIKNGRSRNGGGGAFYIRNNLCFNVKNIF